MLKLAAHKQYASKESLLLHLHIVELVTFGSYLKFYILYEDQVYSTVSSRNAFEVGITTSYSSISCVHNLCRYELVCYVYLLMSAAKARYLPQPPSEKAIEKSKKFMIKKYLILWLEKKGLGWSQDRANYIGAEFVMGLIDALWYVDGHFTTLNDQACPIPQEFDQFVSYNQSERSKHRRRNAENLNATVLDSQSGVLNRFAMQLWLNSTSWKPLLEEFYVHLLIPCPNMLRFV